MQAKILAPLALALLTAGCSSNAPAPEANAKNEAAKPAEAANADSEATNANNEAAEAAKPTGEAKPDPVALAAEARKAGNGGIPVGQRFQAFDIINAVTGESYCQVCRYGGSPKIMATGTIDDPAFKEDLKNIDALLAKYGEDKLKAFAVIAPNKDEHFITPLEDREALQAKAKALAAELELTFPVVLPAPSGEDRNSVFEDHYNVKTSRTLMFADGSNLVKYNEVAPANLASLNTEITNTLGG